MDTTQKNLFDIIGTRRSCRQYRPDPVPRNLLEKVIEAGRLAPSGNNSQSTHFIVITNPEKLAGLRNTLTAAMANTPITEGMPPQMAGLINQAKQGPVEVNYAAPALILTANKKGYANALADSACALENMMLAATATGLGSVWINLYARLKDVPPLRAYMEGLGMAADEEICGSLAIGYAEQVDTAPLPRTGNPVTYVD